MRKVILLMAMLFLFCYRAKSQVKPSKKLTQEYGVIDTADLKMTSCDFEKDANAMVLFDEAAVHYNFSAIKMERHKRIKIFNAKGNGEADIRIEFYGADHDETISDIEAETINLDNNVITYTAVDKKLIYSEKVDKESRAFVFSFPNVKAGSVIEFKYKWTTPYSYNYPDWFFQSKIPSRYSQFDASFSDEFVLTLDKRVYEPMYKDTSMLTKGPTGKRFIWAMANIKSYQEEAFMDYPEDYFQCIISRIQHKNRSWATIGNWLLNDEDFGPELNKTLSKETDIVNKINLLKTDEEKIAYIFDTVRNAMTWNKIDRCYCIDGIRKAWDKKTGNSTEINLILYHFLKIANVDSYLLELKTRKYGKLDIENPTLAQLNKTVILCKVDTTKTFVLDATNKLNTYNIVPERIAGLNALSMEAISKSFRFYQPSPAKTIRSTMVQGDISADGKLEGTTNISSTTYGKVNFIEKYKALGEKKYIEEIEKEYHSLKISKLKLENMDNDSLPLNQSFEFKFSLTEPDGDYIYFNPNLLSGFSANPFLSETRVSNIDFGSTYAYTVNGRYHIPKGYKADALPKSVIMSMPDKSIGFKRVIGVQDDLLLVRFVIDYKQSFFLKDKYASLRDFYKKMFEMLNEPILIKKI